MPALNELDHAIMDMRNSKVYGKFDKFALQPLEIKGDDNEEKEFNELKTKADKIINASNQLVVNYGYENTPWSKIPSRLRMQQDSLYTAGNIDVLLNIVTEILKIMSEFKNQVDNAASVTAGKGFFEKSPTQKAALLIQNGYNKKIKDSISELSELSLTAKNISPKS